MTQPFWVTFSNAPSGCVEDESAEKAREQARAYGVVVTVKILPYPANPRLSPESKRSNCPAFCYRPVQCAGRGSCPQRYACSE